jgi:hypothetical protein
MAGKGAPISPERAKAIYDNLRKPSLAALRRELVRRGQVVSMTTLRKWKAAAWTRKGGAEKPQWTREASRALEQCGLPDDAVAKLEACLKSASDGDLVRGNMRTLLINAALLMAHATAALPELIQRDARGAAVLYGVAGKLACGGVALMRETREIAGRAFRERLAERSVSHR